METRRPPYHLYQCDALSGAAGSQKIRPGIHHESGHSCAALPLNRTPGPSWPVVRTTCHGRKAGPCPWGAEQGRLVRTILVRAEKSGSDLVASASHPAGMGATGAADRGRHHVGRRDANARFMRCVRIVRIDWIVRCSTALTGSPGGRLRQFDNQAPSATLAFWRCVYGCPVT